MTAISSRFVRVPTRTANPPSPSVTNPLTTLGLTTLVKLLHDKATRFRSDQRVGTPRLLSSDASPESDDRAVLLSSMSR
jgi:hypothetical protein